MLCFPLHRVIPFNCIEVFESIVLSSNAMQPMKSPALHRELGVLNRSPIEDFLWVTLLDAALRIERTVPVNEDVSIGHTEEYDILMMNIRTWKSLDVVDDEREETSSRMSEDEDEEEEEERTLRSTERVVAHYQIELSFGLWKHTPTINANPGPLAWMDRDNRSWSQPFGKQLLFRVHWNPHAVTVMQVLDQVTTQLKMRQLVIMSHYPPVHVLYNLRWRRCGLWYQPKLHHSMHARYFPCPVYTHWTRDMRWLKMLMHELVLDARYLEDMLGLEVLLRETNHFQFWNKSWVDHEEVLVDGDFPYMEGVYHFQWSDSPFPLDVTIHFFNSPRIIYVDENRNAGFGPRTFDYVLHTASQPVQTTTGDIPHVRIHLQSCFLPPALRSLYHHGGVFQLNATSLMTDPLMVSEGLAAVMARLQEEMVLIMAEYVLFEELFSTRWRRLFDYLTREDLSVCKE